MSNYFDSVTLVKDPVWPWSSAGGLLALAAVAALLAGLTYWTYRSVPGMRLWQFRSVLGLRLAALAVAACVLLRPSLATRDDLQNPSTLLILADASESMTIQDAYNNQSRWQHLRLTLDACQHDLERLRDEHHVSVAAYRFGAEVSELVDEARPDGKRTDFGQALRSLYERHGHDRNLRGLLILSDGADNGTRFPALSEAARWRSLPCPIHTFALGKATGGDQQRDIALVSIKPEPSPVPVKGRLTVRGTVDAPGFVNASVIVRLLYDGKEVLAQKETLTKSADNEIKLTADAPAVPGELKVTLKIDPLPGEVTTANNEISTFITATKEGIGVLLVDRPRYPEPQLIYDALTDDPRIHVSMVWLRGEGGRAAADLFEFDRQRYDVIILGDLSAGRLAAGQADVLTSIREMISRRGAGLMMTGGYESFGNSDWARTPIEEMLPVELDTGGQIEERWQMKPTPEGLVHYVMRLHENPEANRALWDRLPKLDGYTRLGHLRPGATVLAVRAGTTEPILVSQTFGEGRVLAFAGDTTWRWLRLGQPKGSEGADAHAHFWKQVVFWLAKRDQMEGNVWVKPDNRRLPAGSPLGFSVGLRGKGGMDAIDARFKVRVVNPQGHDVPVDTAREGNAERGIFERTETPGEYRLIVSGSGRDAEGHPIPAAEASARFLVVEENAEMVRRSADHDFLDRLAHAGGGRFYRIDDLPKYLQELPRETPPQGTAPTQLWPDWRQNRLTGFRVSLFLAFVALIGAEWLLRRWWGMV